MCGIVGWIDWERDLSEESPLVERMATTLVHRGPDAQGIWASKRAVLAHRRLSVIDSKAGGQPMLYKSATRNCVITYNGEIYNFQELRHELIGKGHEFRTRSDTEVLLHSYLEWGEECVEHLNGIFAFGIWDDTRQRLILARDHLGVKPLIYAQRETSIIFGSEVKALFAHPAVRPRVGNEGMAEVLCALPIKAPGTTIYRDVFEVPPGCLAIFEHGRTTVSRYWSLESAPHTDDLETTTFKLRELLVDTVHRQLVADVPLATMLSGGLDSSGITALVAREFSRTGRRLSSYTIDFANRVRDFKPTETRRDADAPWATKVACEVGVELRTVMVDSPELLDRIMAPVFALDRPGLGQIDTTLFLLCKAMKLDATVALSGEAADEVFGGYPWFHGPEALTAATFPWVATYQHRASVTESYLSPEVKARLAPRTYVQRRYEEALADVPRLAFESAAAARRRENLFLNQTRLLPTLLDRKDRMSMASGFEVRVPFCDHRLVQYVWNIPWDMKQSDGIEKGILRRAFADVLPDDVLRRRKSPFPKSQNPAYEEAVRRRANEILGDTNAAIQPFVDRSALKKWDESSLNSPAPPPYELIIQIEGWLKAYKVEFA